MAKIGLMVLVGVVVNNGIVLIDHINNLRKAGTVAQRGRSGGLPRTIPSHPDDRLHDDPRPGSARSRNQRNLRASLFPAGQSVMGGLMSSTVLTLIVLPVYYELFDDLSEWVKRIWFLSSPAPTEAEPSPAVGD